jgi:HD-GYP domain-containing protein (c-di-GMP phosphodiesterase class II)
MAPPPGRQVSTGNGRSSGVRLSELVAVLSFASDFGLGQPMEHVLRSCLIALRLADRLGLDERERCETYWVTLIATVCTGESFELAQMFGNDVAFRSGIYHVGPSQLAQMLHALRLAGSNQPAPGRARAAAAILASRGKTVEARFLAHCALTSEISQRFGLDPSVGEALSNTFMRWDGKGIPRGVDAEGVPTSVQLMQLADFSEIHGRLHGVEGAIALARSHAGKMFAPDLARLFETSAAEILADLDDETWDRVIEVEPSPRPQLDEEGFETALEVMADIADVKSPWFSGHSRGVADLAAGAVRAAGMPDQDVVNTRRAGLLHDLGRTGVSNAIWDKPQWLTDSERERVRLHSYYTERMLRRPAALAGLSAIAASHHERLDGSGYHRAIRGSDIPLLGRYLAAADVYHALLEDRPHRPAREPKEAASVLRAEVREGRLHAAAVDAVLATSGHRRSGSFAAPAGLTPREVEVLVLLARGASTRRVAETLNITPKTAGNHIERIYAKIGASSRATATLFALQHGMLSTLEPVQGLDKR